ncbi:MAG: aspartate aminotransferase family protein [Euryarchaeota archaeon]|nr:aspartate aminotransferase family protein [Euryarchaeota archaeon]
MNLEEMKAIETRHESGVFPKRHVDIVRGKGVKVWDSKGREYLDFGANYGVLNVGHNNDAVVKAIKRQADKLIYVPQTHFTEERAGLLDRLAKIAPNGLSKTFLSNSGAEAVEAAIKFARAATGKTGIVSTKWAFHGRTFGALSATYKPEYREPFGPLVPGFSFVTHGSNGELEKAVTSETAAFIIEVVQGEGGVRIVPPDYLRAARRITSAVGALLIIDEIQSGLGRTGRMWALDHFGGEPDIVCVAKSIAGGLPAGATLMRPEVATLPVAAHGNTFGGSPLVCAAANATLDYIVENDLPARAAKMGDALLSGLRSLKSPKIRETRGLGLMCALELRERAGPVLTALIDEGVICLPAGATTIRLLPPLVVEQDQIDFALSRIDRVLSTGS